VKDDEMLQDLPYQLHLPLSTKISAKLWIFGGVPSHTELQVLKRAIDAMDQALSPGRALMEPEARVNIPMSNKELADMLEWPDVKKVSMSAEMKLKVLSLYPKHSGEKIAEMLGLNRDYIYRFLRAAKRTKTGRAERVYNNITGKDQEPETEEPQIQEEKENEEETVFI
jgi:hypothetical protein